MTGFALSGDISTTAHFINSFHILYIIILLFI